MAEDLFDDRLLAKDDTSGLSLPSSEFQEPEGRLHTNVRLLAVASFFQDLGSQSLNILLPLFLLKLGHRSKGRPNGAREHVALFRAARGT